MSRILLVEDEALVAMLVEDILLDLGHEVVGPAANRDEALRLIGAEEIDLAILDVNLGGTPSYAVADALRAKGIRFLFATGYGGQGLDAAYADAPTLQKPFRQAEVQSLIDQLIAQGS